MKTNKIYFGRQSLLAITLFFFTALRAFPQINFQKFPINNQILQRDDKDEAIVAVSGTVNADLRGKVTLKVWKEEELFSENEVNLTGQTQDLLRLSYEVVSARAPTK